MALSQRSILWQVITAIIEGDEVEVNGLRARIRFSEDLIYDLIEELLEQDPQLDKFLRDLIIGKTGYRHKMFSTVELAEMYRKYRERRNKLKNNVVR